MKMKSIKLVMVFGIAFLLLITGNAFALDFGLDITRYDGSGDGTGWWGAQEDQEVELNCIGSQVWDLEGFFLKGSKLTMVGGWDFKNGASGYNFPSGDLFIDVLGINNGNSYGYDYVFDMDFAGGSYNIYKLTENSIIEDVYYSQNNNSNPWRYKSGGITVVENGSIGYYAGLSDSDTGFMGGTHYAASVALDFLDPGAEFRSHFTMKCGNDNLIGQGTAAPVPEPSTMILMGIGLIGIAGFGRKKLMKT